MERLRNEDIISCSFYFITSFSLGLFLFLLLCLVFGELSPFFGAAPRHAAAPASRRTARSCTWPSGLQLHPQQKVIRAQNPPKSPSGTHVKPPQKSRQLSLTSLIGQETSRKKYPCTTNPQSLHPWEPMWNPKKCTSAYTHF